MSLETQIMEQLKTAMKEKNQVALAALRAVKSAILLEKTSTSAGEISEADELKILQKQVKMRKEAAEQFANNNAQEMADEELAQAKIIEQFLPAQLSEAEITQAIEKIIADTGATSGKDMGKVMGVANKELAGKADGKMISTIVKALLN